MDLLSCPQEMLASVFKYNALETVTRLRKTNKYIDYVATKYRMNLPRMWSINFIRPGQPNARIGLQYRKKDIYESNIHDDHLRRYVERITCNQSEVLNVFDRTIKKIRSTEKIGFMDGEIDQNIINILHGIKNTKRTSLWIRNCNFDVALEKLTAMLAKYPNSEMRIEPDNKIMNELIGTHAVIISLLPYAAIYYDISTQGEQRSAFTDETLRIARDCLPHTFQLGYHCPFSLTEIKKTMLHLIKCSKEMEKNLIEWAFGYLQMNSEEKLQNTVNELSAIPGILINQSNGFAYIVYKMDLPSCPQEMLASVLKYTTFETVTRIRKTNKHMDYVATKYRMNLPRVWSASIVRYDHLDVEILVKYQMEKIWDYKKHNWFFYSLKPNLTYNQSTILHVFEVLVEKMRLTAFISFNDGEIDESALHLLKRLKLREKVYISFENCNYAVTVTDLVDVLAKYKNSQIVMNSSNRIMNIHMGTDEVVIPILSHSNVYFDLGSKIKHLPLFTNNVLQVARLRLPLKFKLGCYCPFSLSEIKKTMLCLIEYLELNKNRKIEWDFGVLRLESNRELHAVVKELTTIPGSRVMDLLNSTVIIWFDYGKAYNLFKIKLIRQ